MYWRGSTGFQSELPASAMLFSSNHVWCIAALVPTVADISIAVLLCAKMAAWIVTRLLVVAASPVVAYRTVVRSSFTVGFSCVLGSAMIPVQSPAAGAFALRRVAASRVAVTNG